MKKVIAFLIVSLVLLPINCFASFWDSIIGILSEINGTLNGQLTPLNDKLSNLNTLMSDLKNKNEIGFAKELGALTGSYGMGNLYNSFSYQQDRQWSPTTWAEALNSASGMSSHYQQLYNDYGQRYPSVNQQTIINNLNSDTANSYQQAVQTNRAVYVNSTYAFDRINKNLQQLYQLSKSIEQTKNQKEALDLNSRLIAQIGYINTQIAKQLILSNQAAVSSNQQYIDGVSSKAAFNQ